MKKLKALFSILLAGLSLVTQANLPCKNGPCPSGCPCMGRKSDTARGGGNGESGSPLLNWIKSLFGISAKNGSIDIQISFGDPATERIGQDCYFSIYTDKPSPVVYSPQMLQYLNPFTNRISQNVISETYKDSLGLPYTENEPVGDGPDGENGTSPVFLGGYGTNQLSSSLPSGVTHQTRIIGSNRTVMIFNFTENNTTAEMTGESAYLGYRLQMVDENGSPVTSSPYYYDMYIGYGNFVRYRVSTGFPVSYHTASGRVMKPSDPSVGVEVVYDSEDIIRQVWSKADGLADVIVTEPLKSYEIRFYYPSQVGGKSNGVYQASGSPFTVLRIEKPTDGDNSVVLVTKTVGATSYQTLYRYSYASEGWTMYRPGNLSVDSKTTMYDDSETVKTVMEVVKTADGTVAKKTSNVYQTFGFGDRIVSSTLDPDGIALRSTFSYYTDQTDKGGYGRVATENLATGSWRRFRYNQAGWVTQIVSPWLNSAFDSPAAESASTTYSYEPLDARDTITPGDERPRTAELKILGQTVKKTFKAYYFDDGAYTEVQREAVVPNAAWNTSGNLQTTWRYYPKGNAASSASAGRLQRLTKPDGTTESYTYEYGNLSQDANTGAYTFTPGSGDAVRVYVTHGTAASPAGIAYKTTREERFYNVRGDMVYKGMQIYTGSSYETAEWVRNTYDEQHRIVAELKSNGELTETSWNCCNKASETLPDGTRYLYAYDEMSRLVSKTKVGIGNQPDLVTTYVYNADGKVVSETVSGGALSESETREFNLAGLLTRKVDKQGLVTTFSYLTPVNTGSSRRGLTTTAVLPGGATQIYALHCDGQPESLTGTAQVPKYYRYGVNADGAIWRRELIAGGDSSRRITQVMGMNGAPASVTTSGFNGNVVEEFSYNAKNQLIKSSKTGRVPLLGEYDEIGNLARVGLDVDSNGSLAPASNDRIFDQSTVYEYDNGWWKKTTGKTYATANSASATTVKSERTRLSGFANGIVSETQTIDIHGNTTTATTTVDRANKTVTESVLYPDSTVAEQTVTVNGLKTSERTKTNLTTTFGYDGLGRIISATDPRTGTATVSYHTSTGKNGLKATVTDAAGDVTSYDYDTTTGRLIWEKNALNQYTRYTYNDRGEITNIWGDTQYPVEFGYNEFGERTTMRTYRTGTSWNASSWPTGVTGDLTTWVYDPASGLVTAKTDAANQSVSYTYTVDGKLASRTWARGITTAYSYNAATGELLNVDYADTTPDITFTYNRLGQMATVQDAAGTRTFTYNATLDQIQESISGLYSKTLNRTYTSTGAKGRPLSLTVDNNLIHTFAYDTYGRINQITTPAGSFGYSRLANSDLVAQLTRPNGVNTAWSYEQHRDLVTQVQNGSVSTFGYANNAIGNRTAMSRSGSAFTAPDTLTYGYNSRSEVISAQSNADSTYNYAYSFDPIGNRLTASLAGQSFSYTANALNQYTAVNTEQPTYDADGNMLTRDGWTQVWNGENRLIEISKGSVKLQFAYDYMGRRVEKKVYSGTTLTQHTRFVYDGYKLVEELDALNNNAVLRRYSWQPEAQGIDVPLSVFDASANASYSYTTDANKNVSDLTDASGNVVAHYEYSPFGQLTKATGSYASSNPFRFSSEYYDTETGLVYYNYRYYDAKLGRWLSRDPIGEKGGENIYNFIKNNIITTFDVLGFERKRKRQYRAIDAYEILNDKKHPDINQAFDHFENSPEPCALKKNQIASPGYDWRAFWNGFYESLERQSNAFVGFWKDTLTGNWGNWGAYAQDTAWGQAEALGGATEIITKTALVTATTAMVIATSIIVKDITSKAIKSASEIIDRRRLNDYPANPDKWNPPRGWKETPSGQKTNGRHRQWTDKNGTIRRRWDASGREAGKPRGPHWHDDRFPNKHIEPNR